MNTNIEPYDDVVFEAGCSTFDSLKRLADEVIRVRQQVAAMEDLMVKVSQQLHMLKYHGGPYSDEVRVWINDR